MSIKYDIIYFSFKELQYTIHIIRVIAKLYIYSLDK